MSVYEVFLVLYVDAVVAVTVMRVLLFGLHVCMLRDCEGDGNAGVGNGGGVGLVSAGHVGGPREMCLARRGRRGGGCIRGLCLGLTIPMG